MLLNNPTLFSITKSQFKRWPILEVYNLLDYSVADRYRDEYKYVWLKNKTSDINPTFNWSWEPHEGTEDLVHCFPACLEESLRPISWNELKLVSTDPRKRKKEIRQPLIARHVKENFSVFYYGFDETDTIAKFNAKKQSDPVASIARVISDYDNLIDTIKSVNTNMCADGVYFLHIDVDTSIDSILDTTQFDNNSFVSLKLDHHANHYSFADDHMIYVSREFLIKCQSDNSLYKQKVYDNTKTYGSVNDYRNPLNTWSNAYRNTIKIYNNLLDVGKLKNKILTDYISHTASRLDAYMKDGCETAAHDFEKLADPTSMLDDVESHIWMYERFLARQQEKNKQTVNPAAELARIKAKYGKDSEEYNNALKAI